MRKRFYSIIIISFSLIMLGCTNVSQLLTGVTEPKQAPAYIYYSAVPLFMTVSDFKGTTAGFLPDFVNYSTDLNKYGLRGAVSTVSWEDVTLNELSFDKDGKFIYVEQWFGRDKRYGSHIGFKYDETGRLQYMYNQRRVNAGSSLSSNSERYEYNQQGKLICRDFNLYKKAYHYYENGNLKSVDFVPAIGDNGSEDTYFTCDDKGNIQTMKRYVSRHLLLQCNGTLFSTYTHGDDGLCIERKDIFYPQHWKSDSICCVNSYAYNEKGDLAAWKYAVSMKKGGKTNEFAGTCDFEYTYDEQGNWIQMTTIGNSLNDIFTKKFLTAREDGRFQYVISRTLTYYTDVEMRDYRKGDDAKTDNRTVTNNTNTDVKATTNDPVEAFFEGSNFIGSTNGELVANAPGTVAVGDQFRINYTMETENIRSFKAPPFDRFEVLMGPSKSTSKSTTKINGSLVTKSFITYTYILQAQKEGNFTVSGAIAESKGKTYTSNSVTIKVTPI